MHPVFLPVSKLAPARILATALCALMAVTPVEGKRVDSPTTKSTNASASKSHNKKVKGPAPASKKGSSAKSSSTARRSATKARGKKKYVSPAERRRRAAQAHKIRL